MGDVQEAKRRKRCDWLPTCRRAAVLTGRAVKKRERMSALRADGGFGGGGWLSFEARCDEGGTGALLGCCCCWA
jgi:hypothetical protein